MSVKQLNTWIKVCHRYKCVFIMWINSQNYLQIKRLLALLIPSFPRTPLYHRSHRSCVRVCLSLSTFSAWIWLLDLWYMQSSFSELTLHHFVWCALEFKEKTTPCDLHFIAYTINYDWDANSMCVNLFFLHFPITLCAISLQHRDPAILFCNSSFRCWMHFFVRVLNANEQTSGLVAITNSTYHL